MAERAKPSWWARTDGGIRISVTVIAGARRTEVVGAVGSALRLKVAARPVEGQANEELVRFLAKLFDVRRSAVTLVHGRRARAKVVDIIGVDAPPAVLLRWTAEGS